MYDKKKEREVLWNADPEYWGRHAPILFPFVGKLNGGVYHYEGNEYTMSAHGFAGQRIRMRGAKRHGCNTPPGIHRDTKKNYPFDFELLVTHRLTENHISVEWTVKNTDTKTLYYSIGGHPAFNVDSVKGCRLIFEGMDKLSCTGIDLPTGTADAEHPATLALTDHVYTVGEHTFDADTMVFDEGQVKKVSLQEADGTKRVTLICPDAQHVGIWSRYRKMPVYLPGALAGPLR